MAKEVYLGDGLYASDEGFQFKLRAPRDHEDHVIYLESEVLQEFFAFISKSRGLRTTIEKSEVVDHPF